MNGRAVLRASGAFLWLTVRTTSGEVEEFTDRQAWFDAVDEVVTTIDFTEYPVGTILTDQYDGWGVLFTDGDDVVVQYEDLFPEDGKGLGAYKTMGIAFTTPEPQTAIAVDFPDLVLISLFSDGELLYSGGSGVNGTVGNFLGLISTEPFDTVVFHEPNAVLFVDDLHYVAGPLTPCPDWIPCEAAKLVAFDPGNRDDLGRSVAVWDDILVAGAPEDDPPQPGHYDFGSAYIFDRQDGTGWTFAQKLTADDAAGLDNFGRSVVVAGDVLAVGAPFHDDGASNAGAIYIYRRNDGSWELEQKLLAPDAQPYDDFGWALAVHPGPPLRLVASAPFDDDNGPDAGSVYVFRFDDGPGWTFEQKLLAGDGQPQDNFGCSVAIDGGPPTRIAAGAYNDDDNGFDSGSAYVFRFDEPTATWAQEQKLLADDGQPEDQFGVSVSASGDAVLVGSAWDDDNGDNAGAAYVFRYSEATSSWSQEQKLPGDLEGDQFGIAVSVTGDTAVVGAHLDDEQSSHGGSATLYVFDGASWTRRQKLFASGENFSLFGRSVSTWRAGGSVRIAVGAPWARPQSVPFAGAAYVFNIAPGRGDFNCDGALGVDELLAMLAAWGPCADQENCPSDLDCNGTVGVDDFLLLFATWGP